MNKELLNIAIISRDFNLGFISLEDAIFTHQRYLDTTQSDKFDAYILADTPDNNVRLANIAQDAKKVFIMLFEDGHEQKSLFFSMKYAVAIANKNEKDAISGAIEKLLFIARAQKDLLNISCVISNQNKYVKIGELIFSIAHQLRQPINAISTEITRLKLYYGLANLTATEMHEIISNVNTYTKKMSTIISNFLNYLSPNMEKTTFSLASMLSEISLILRQPLNKENIRLTIEPFDDIVIFGNQNTLFESILNIVSNSKDAYENNEAEGKREVLITVAHNDEGVTIKISDCAGGVDDTILSKIFDAYYTTKEPTKGSGLGLYICKNIIERDFAGSIRAYQNEAKNGLCVEINLPIV